MAGERQVSVIETQSVTSGFVESAQQGEKLDAVFEKVVFETKELESSQISLGSTLDRLDAKYNLAARQAQEYARVLDKLNRAEEAGEGSAAQRSRILIGLTEKHAAEAARAAGGVRNLGTAVNDNARTFGLAGHQVQNLTFQLNDLVTQIASGGGIFRPLIQQGGQVFQVLQMGEGGVGGVLKNIGASLTRIGPLALTAFGAAGVAGAVALAANALSNFQENLKRSEASVRALTDSSAQANRVLAGAAEAAKGTRLAAEDLQQLRLQAETLANTSGRIEQLANGLTRLAPSLNAQAFTQGVTNIVSSLDASEAEMQQMIAAVIDLSGKLTLTAGEAQKLARQFPQLMQVMAQAFGTTPQGLLQLPKQLEISTVRLEELFTAAGKAKGGSDSLSSSLLNLAKSFGGLIADLATSTDKLIGLSETWDWFWGNVAKGANRASRALDSFRSKAEESANAPSPQAPPRSTAWDPTTAGSSSRGGGGQREILYGREISQTGEQTLRAIHEGNVTRERAAEQAADAARQAQRDAAEQKAAEEAGRAAAERYQEYVAKNIADRQLAQSRGFNWTGQGALDAFGKALDPARNSLNGLAAAATKVTHSIIARENTMAEIFPTGFISWERQQTVEEFLQNRNAQTRGGLAAQNAGWAGRILRGEDFFPDPADAQEALDDVAESATTAANNLGDLSSLGAPIEQKIDTLRGLQEAALSRAYRPDPYAEKNPEFFYNGEKIMKEAQDKIYDGLQAQIVKLESLQSSLGTLVMQNERLPQTLVDALVAAGFADIAQKIVAAFTTVDAPSATPNPTAVQDQSYASATWTGAKTYNTTMRT